jgi:hypothetical protein
MDCPFTKLGFCIAISSPFTQYNSTLQQIGSENILSVKEMNSKAHFMMTDQHCLPRPALILYLYVSLECFTINQW